MIKAIATTYAQASPLSVPYLPSSYETFETDPPLRPPLWREFYGAKKSEWLSKSIISANVVLPVLAVTNSVVSVEEGEFFTTMFDTHERQTEAFGDSVFTQRLLEYDTIVDMPPRKEYTITLKVISISKAEPNIVEPDWLDL
jgi:hypothetical protein